MTLSGAIRTGQMLEDANLYSKKCLEEFRRDPASAREYIKSKGRISRWLLEQYIVGDATKYHAAKQVLREIER